MQKIDEQVDEEVNIAKEIKNIKKQVNTLHSHKDVLHNSKLEKHIVKIDSELNKIIDFYIKKDYTNVDDTFYNQDLIVRKQISIKYRTKSKSFIRWLFNSYEL